MSLQTALQYILKQYPKSRHTSFSNNNFGNYVRHNIPAIIMDIVNDDRYIIQGSVGKGNWSKSPWIAVFDKLITNTVQCGYYPVYLFSEDFSGFYLSLNQGVTVFKEEYRAKTKDALKAKAIDYLAQLGSLANDYKKGPIDLKHSKENSNNDLYGTASIISVYYSAYNIPDEQILIDDLRKMLKIYNYLSASDVMLLASVTQDEVSGVNSKFFEDPTKIRLHRRIERNTALSNAAKKSHGYKCQACDVDMGEIYGPIGANYIEAHHLRPISSIESKILMDPKKDFSVLCPNCHAMIHRSEYVSDVEAFKNIVLYKNTK
ncbi:MrcB family domain-containing protein [Seleniivibrio woodruffii]|uniref:5-methylcytosine-specific restriction protein A n=1 Tax=Seleniivibrio woodruffii TaxID=1078050 RepID=A0A4R1K9G0_9BACT|nr:DUF3578 domain-containing protein [Seleniivibrio woodruffii]TCK60493.1 5-methylcytosine-specific restriction protein A [Seleniivibrio woodruffii]TVZ36121.1 5-methylcytosine-specific restriction protein A [Seleniivibrio woodruffii]